jgi:hypothetical protein
MLVLLCAVAAFGMVNVHCMVHVLGGDSVPAAPVVVAHVAPLGSSLCHTIPLRGMDDTAPPLGSGNRGAGSWALSWTPRRKTESPERQAAVRAGPG